MWKACTEIHTLLLEKGEAWLKKKFVFLMIGIIVLATSVVLVLTNDKIIPGKGPDSKAEKTVQSPLRQINEKNKQPVEKEFPMNMSEYDIQVAIHAMTHQKVKAEDKWTSILMTPERVERLLEVVKAKRDRFEKNGPLYIDILQRWARDDFSKIDQDHNAIWMLQGGTVGRATGILTEQQEEKFIEELLNDSEDK